ncbi:hypothetical protein [Gaetbulibacter saemankumensis]|uniref:hypothetical protein n=1 Tax=Gaetbulibacter saemankumensis TaxID=311208 RepID=UPI00040A8722|nr:hypothetical protein [Gaetbulibacter saemankumensis]
MNHLLNHSAELLILLFLIVTFFMSFLDKITDWKGNISFLSDYFSKTFLSKQMPLILPFIVLLEAATTLFCSIGIYQIMRNDKSLYALLGSIFACIILLIFLLGQRIAKDYDGARNITIYFIVALFSVFLLQ